LEVRVFLRKPFWIRGYEDLNAREISRIFEASVSYLNLVDICVDLERCYGRCGALVKFLKGHFFWVLPFPVLQD
jgi:hypothetical protein